MEINQNMKNNIETLKEIRKTLENDLKNITKDNLKLRRIYNKKKKQNRQETLRFIILSILAKLN